VVHARHGERKFAKHAGTFFLKIKEATHMSQQAFSLARQKVKWEAFEELFQASVRGSYNEVLKDWRGFLLMAIDSSHIALPRDAGLRAYYGAVGKGLSAATARASLLYDIENDIIVDAKIGKLSYPSNIYGVSPPILSGLIPIVFWFLLFLNLIPGDTSLSSNNSLNSGKGVMELAEQNLPRPVPSAR
jgi:hypothetical protein